MKLKNIIVVMGCLLAAGASRAQEKTLSQYYSNRMLLNPAMTGIMPGTVLGVNYRSQTNDIQLPLRILGVGAEHRFNSMGVGVVLNSQSSGDGGFKTTNTLLSFAYHLPVDPKNLISFGLQGGITSQSFDVSKLTFASQYSSAFGPVFPSGENFNNTRSTAVDVNAGMFYSNTGNGKVRPFGGVAVFHLNEPEQNITSVASKIPARLLFHGGADVRISDQFSLIPHVAYFSQAKANLVSGGVNAKINVGGNIDGIYIGANYKNNDAATFLAGMVYSQFALGFSYDVPVGNTSTASIGQHAIEFSINYSFNKNKDNNNLVFPVF